MNISNRLDIYFKDKNNTAYIFNYTKNLNSLLKILYNLLYFMIILHFLI